MDRPKELELLVMAIVCEACKVLHPVTDQMKMISLSRNGYTLYFCSTHVVVSRPGQPIEVDGKPLS